MSYCRECGSAVADQEAEPDVTVVEAPEVSPVELEIARVQADRDIRLAKIQAGMTDVERDIELAAAEATAEALSEVIAPPAPDQPDTVILDAPTAEEPAPEPDASLPEAEGHSEHKHSGYGHPGWFG